MATTNPIQIQKYLKGVTYPASRDDLISQAEKQGADDEILELLARLDDQEHETPAEVSKAIGKLK